MANTISLCIDVSITDTGVLNDETTYTSPQRVDVGVFMSAFKTNSSSVQTPVEITGTSSDPQLDAEWNFNIDVDGWYQFYYVAIPEYLSGQEYALHDAIYDTTSGNVYKSLAAANIGNDVSDTTFWEIVEDPASLAENEGDDTESANIDSAIYQRILIPKVDRLYGDKAVQIARECCNDCEIAEHTDAFEIVFALREGALISEERLEYADGEKMIRRLDEFVDCN
jgi:hypothetical protein